jgi:type I restriction-modification system DNA methylase subunit
MLNYLYDIFYQKFKEPVKSWDYFIEFLMGDHNPAFIPQFTHRFEWLINESKLIQAINDTYNPKLLKQHYYDHLGEMYLENVVSKNEAYKKSQFLTPESVAETMAQISIKNKNEYLSIIDPAAGTGRLLMAAYKYAPNSLLFGVDVDIRCVRIGLTNFAIHNIPGYFLNADSLKHEIDISNKVGLHNWQFSNKWHSCMDQLKPSLPKTKSQLQLFSGNGKNKK